MTAPERPAAGAPGGGPLQSARARRWLGLLALAALLLAAIALFARNGGGAGAIAPGQRLAPFAVPLATGALDGYSNVATHAREGAAGGVPACSVRKPGALNVCALYEGAPLVLALFVDEGACAQVLSRMQAVSAGFPGVRFAAVAIEGDPGEFASTRRRLRALIRRRRLTLPVGIDRDGVLAGIYRMVSCPQVSFAYPGGTVQSRALLQTPSVAQLRARVAALASAARARGWRGPHR